MWTLMVFLYQFSSQNKPPPAQMAAFVLAGIPTLLVFIFAQKTIMRGIIVDGVEPYLPEWDDWGQLLIDGFRLLGAGLIYALPVLILPFLGYMIAFLPAFMVPWLEGVVDTSAAVSAIFPILGLMLGFGTMGIGILLAVTIGLLVPAALGHLVAKDRFLAAFEITAWWPIFRVNFTGYLLVFVLIMGFVMIGSIIFQILYLTIVLCCLMPLVFSVFSMYLSLVSLTLFAEAYLDGVRKLDV